MWHRFVHIFIKHSISLIIIDSVALLGIIKRYILNHGHIFLFIYFINFRIKLGGYLYMRFQFKPPSKRK